MRVSHDMPPACFPKVLIAGPSDRPAERDAADQYCPPIHGVVVLRKGSAVLLASLAAGALGLVAAPGLTRRGLAQLDHEGRYSAVAVRVAAVVGVCAGAVAVTAAHRTGSWYWLPGLLVWAVILVSAGLCDASVQRIPTPLVRTGATAVVALMCVAGFGARDWRGWASSVIASIAAASILALCWRFAGAGFGDVRIAAFGGLGLGHTTQRGLLLALSGFTILLTAQALWTLARTKDRTATVALGPALAIGFLIAAAA